ncbi:NAD(P)/FAD-dependent oxidoreductase [uncultured Lentibacter sp.]|uniref:NAD(P)/FAD-dependent oxidoreductase n=1 Tax=uncultured Lentibacter sp. TaxID=1659309 RepID=UPI00262B3B6F|nr:FAD-dependent oxidoreductase [uncultured Lentibacter sp.]
MSFDAPPLKRQRIAIVGGGISGMSAAYKLSPQHDVTLYEAAPRLGGHARTKLAGLNGDQPVDTGFIVFNYVNYPHLTRMFHDLDVPVEKSNMSFGATIDGGRVEYGLQSLKNVFGQRRNALRPGYLRMIRDILRFNARAEATATSDDMTIGELVRELGLGSWFERYYLMPICGAIWSSPTQDIRAFPAKSLVRFFSNHALLTATQPHQWYTVSGGSIEYVRRLERHLRATGVSLRTGAPITAVKREAGRVTIKSAHGSQEYDQLIMACHSDEALALLADPSAEETRLLSAVGYQDNEMILHRDTAQMPKRRACWSSWVYKADGKVEAPSIGVTYWMNRLQNIPETDPLFVSLNPYTPVRDSLIYDQKSFRHPVFDGPALKAQQEIKALQGTRNTWFAGAWLRNGFHEDGFASAVRVAREIERVSV